MERSRYILVVNYIANVNGSSVGNGDGVCRNDECCIDVRHIDTVGVSRWIKKYDPTRLVNPASGGNDFPVGDIHDLHRYPGPIMPPARGTRASVLGEFGGLGLPVEGHLLLVKDNWGYVKYKTPDALQAAYADLIAKLRPLKSAGLTAAVYTQTTDVEIEINGLMTYDRAVIKVDPDWMRKLNRSVTAGE